MKSFNSNYLAAMSNLNGEPTVYVKINTTAGYDIYITSHVGIKSVTGLDRLIDGALVSLTTSSEKLTPEKGFSTLGGGSIVVNEALLTDELRSLLSVQKTIFNQPVEIYSGDQSLVESDYEKVQTLYVKTTPSSDVSYNITLSTVQLFSKKQIFNAVETELFADFASNDAITEIEVLSTTGFELVAHDSQWQDSPNEEVGYLRVEGQDVNGNPVIEILKYWSKDATHFYGDPSNSNKIERSVFNTGLVTATGTSSGVGTQILEHIYIDLAVGKMIIALLTGELYGQVGKTLPVKWHAGISTSFIDITSIENIGFDLWNPADDTGFHPYIDQPEQDDAKSYIAREILRVSSLAFRTDVNGEMSCTRYGQVILGSTSQVVLEDGDVTNTPIFDRNVSDVRNIFAVRWDYRAATQRYLRSEVIVDLESQSKNNIVSQSETILLKAVRNNQLEVNSLLKTVTDGIRTRLTNPSIKPKITATFRRTVALEVLDVIMLDLVGFADYGDIADVNRPFEIQSIQHNWIDRTCTMSLFGSTDPASPIDISVAAPSATIDHAGFLPFASNLTGSFTDTGTVLTFTGNCDLGIPADIGGTKKYYYNGEIDFDGFNLDIWGTVITDSDIFDVTSASINGVGTGTTGGDGQIALSIGPTLGESGYFGTVDTAQQGMGVSQRNTLRGLLSKIMRPNQFLVNKGVGVIENFVVTIDENGVLQGLPEKLTGNSGSGGMWAKSIDTAAVSNGGDGSNGGAGLFIITNSFISNASTNIDLSGDDVTDLTTVETTFNGNFNFAGGLGGVGYGGCLCVLIKNRGNPLASNADNMFTSRSGALQNHTGFSEFVRPFEDQTFKEVVLNQPTVLNKPFIYEAVNASNIDKNFAGVTFLSKYISGQVQNIPQVGRDDIAIISAPASLALTESIDTPSSPLGNISTITMNVTPPSDSNYSHSQFTFRAINSSNFYPTTYKTSNESTFEVTSNGLSYEVKAQSVSKQLVLGGFTLQTITVKNVKTEPAIEPSVRIPKVTGLQLKNRIQNNVFDKFKSGNAEFTWNAVSNTSAVGFGNEGLLGAGAGSFDAYFKDYEVTIYNSNNNLIRTEFTTSESFTYTLDKNKKDQAGRVFSIQIRARGQNNQVGDGFLFRVENPAPDAPSQLSAKPSYNSIQVDYTRPDNDIDYIGVNMRFRLTPAGAFSAIFFFATTSCIVGDLVNGTEYEIELTSVDEFGAGSGTSIISTTQAIPAAEIDGLGNWATELDPVDLAFIQANMDNGSIESDKVVSLTAAKITAGQIDVAVDIGTGVQLDGANGTVKTTNNDFTVIIGSSDGSWNQLPNPTAITNLNTGSNTQTFGVDVLGNCVIGSGVNAVTFISGVIGFGSNVTIGSNADQTVTVGASGDYATLNLALEALSKIVPAYKNGGFTAEINILTGTTITELIHINGIDLSFIKIVSDDSIVNATVTGTDIFFRVTNGGISPKIAVKFRNTVNGAGFGAYADNSIIRFEAGSIAGMENFLFGITALNSSTIIANSISVIDSQSHAIGSFSDSHITAILSNANDSGDPILADGGSINANQVTANNSTGIVIQSRNGAVVTFTQGVATNSNRLIDVNSSSVDATLADFSGWDEPLVAVPRIISVDSDLTMTSCDLTTTDTPVGAVASMTGGNADFSYCSLATNSGSNKGVLSYNNADGSAAFSNSADLRVNTGSVVKAAGATNATFNVTTNTISSSGIIFN